MAHAQVVSAEVPKPPNKPKKGQPYRLHVILPGELVEAVDRFAETVDEFEPTRSRTEAVRLLLVDALQRRGVIKK